MAQLLLDEGFEASPEGWSLINEGGSDPWFIAGNQSLADLGVSAKSGNASAIYYFNPDVAANTWLISKAVSLTAGASYTMSFFYITGGYPEKLKITVGTQATVAGQSNVVWDNDGTSELTNEDWERGTFNYTPAISGTYYFGFNCYSEPDQYFLLLDDVKLGITPTAAPTCPTLIAPASAATNVNPYRTVKFDWTPSANTSGYNFHIFSTGTPSTASDSLLSVNVSGDSLFLPGLDYGTTYYWQILPENLFGQAPVGCGISSFTTIAYPAAPINDNCNGAISISNSQAIVGSTIGATQSLAASACGGQAGSANDDVWYSFVATGTDTATIAIQGDENFDGVLEVFSGSDCASLMPLACKDTSFLGEVEYLRLTGLTKGQTYYFRVYDWYAGTGATGQFLVQLTGAGVVLPINLTKFTGERKQDVNVLRWETATETNNSGFELQRSVDGVNFSSIGFVKSKSQTGNSTNANQYEFTDSKPFSSSNYYRLNQLDKDGRSTYSQIVRLLGITNRLELVTLYPNPTKGLVNVAIVSPKANKITFTVTDITGKVVLSRTMAVANGDNNLQLDVQQLSAGSYMLKATCADGCETSVKKFIKK